MTGNFVGRWHCRECDRIWIEFSPARDDLCPECDVCLAYSIVNAEAITLKLTADSGPQRGREDVNLTELSEDKAAAIRAIVDGRSVIYRCSIVGGKIRTTSGPTIIGNTFDSTQINDDPVHIGSNKFTNSQVRSTGAIVRNYFTP